MKKKNPTVKKKKKPTPAERAYAAFKDGALSAMLAHATSLNREAEERIRENLIGYIDARRSGWLMRDKMCCELFEKFVNYCPFCGVKL